MKKYTFVFPLIFILVLAYWRYTYIINLNIEGEQILINIRNLRFNQISLNTDITIFSIIIYWMLFLLGNMVLFLTLFGWAEKVKIVTALYLLISFVSALFFVLDTFLLASPFFFNLAATLKNFLLSPMFTAIAYLMVSSFQWFEKPS